MRIDLDDCIAALASPPGPAARGIIRVSGPSAKPVIERVFTPEDRSAWNSAGLPLRHRGRIELDSLRCPLPASVLLWPTSRSYTGQPMAEIHTAGSPPLLELVLEALHRHEARPARPGEFTLRAFLAGRIDLPQAEAVLGVIDANDHDELEVALRQLAGGLSGRLAGVREDLLQLLGDLEAGLDFVEEDITFVSAEETCQRIDAARKILQALADQADSRMQSRVAPRVVLAGLPNAGKSTLFNALAGVDAAIVSEVSGTTRDYLSLETRLAGMPVTLIDTAGWEDRTHIISEQAQAFREEQQQQADLIVWCSACGQPGEAAELDQRQRELWKSAEVPLLLARTKSDLSDSASSVEPNAFFVSAVDGNGIEELSCTIAAVLQGPAPRGRQLLGSTASRCRDTLARSMDSLSGAYAAASGQLGDELVCLDLRAALDDLGAILGLVYTDDILDHIFSNFCIGK